MKKEITYSDLEQMAMNILKVEELAEIASKRLELDRVLGKDIEEKKKILYKLRELIKYIPYMRR